MARSRRDDDDDEDDEKPRKKSRRPADDDEDDEPVRPAAKKKPAKPIDDDDEDDEDTPPPRKKPVVKVAPKKRVADDDDDEDDDAPRRKKKVVAKDDGDEDEEDDDDDSPKSKYKGKGKGKKKGGISKPLLIGGILGAIFVLCGCGVGGYFAFLGGDSPKSAFVAFQKDAGDSKWDGVWERMDKASQDDLAKDPMKKFPGKSGKDLFIAKINDPMMGDLMKFLFLSIAAGTVESVDQTGDSATVKVKLDVMKGPFGGMGTAETKPFKMTKEGGKWKVNMKDSMK
jgi:hypothetical protein